MTSKLLFIPSNKYKKFANMEEAWFINYTAARHQGARTLWSMSMFIYSQ